KRKLPRSNDQHVPEIPSPAPKSAKRESDREMRAAKSEGREKEEKDEHRASNLSTHGVGAECSERRHDRDALYDRPHFLREPRRPRGAVYVERAKNEERERREHGAEPEIGPDRRNSER